MTVKVRPYKRGGWEYDIVLTFPGRPTFRERRKAPVPTKAAARRWAEERERQIIAHYTNTDPSADDEYELPDVAKKQVPTLAAFIPRYMENFCDANRHRPSTISRKRSACRAHLIPKLGHKRLDRISAEDVQQLRASMADLKPVTVNTVTQLLKAILNVAVEWKVIPEMPVKIKKLRVADDDAPFYDFEEYSRLVATAKALDPRTHLVVLLGGDAGLRRGEIIALEWDDIDLVHGRLSVARSEFRGAVTSTKGHRTRTVPLSEALKKALKDHRIGGPRVLYARQTKKRTTTPVESTIRNWISAAQTAAGFKAGGIHILRHTFCSHLAMRGAPARAIQKLAGHQSVVTTERYMNLSPVALEESVRLLNRRPVWRNDGDGDDSPINIQ